MIESIEFTNFKALRKTTLPLAPFTLLLGPNGSGKTSVLQALQAIANSARTGGGERGMLWSSLHSVTAEDKAPVDVKLRLRWKNRTIVGMCQWRADGGYETMALQYSDGTALQPADQIDTGQWLARMQTYALDASAIARPSPVQAGPFGPNG